MQGSLNHPPIIVRMSRWTTLWRLLVSLVFTGGAVGALLDSMGGRIRGVLGIIIFITMLPFRIVFVGLAILLSIFVHLDKPDQDLWVAWIVLFLLGCFSLKLAFDVLWPNTLEIGPSGVHRRGLLLRRSFQWRDIGNFRCSYSSREWMDKIFGVAVVGDYHPEGTVPEGVNSLGSGREWDAVELAKGAGVKDLGSGWELDGVELAKLLNAARARWLKSGPH